mmetsp:Transcript_124987/g.278895  ORF Transcript_124987/g.278895 Transcript_124987/m.278895 type:complete len:218 (+) Transcript_124987:366-1019(+)
MAAAAASQRHPCQASRPWDRPCPCRPGTCRRPPCQRQPPSCLPEGFPEGNPAGPAAEAAPAPAAARAAAAAEAWTAPSGGAHSLGGCRHHCRLQHLRRPRHHDLAPLGHGLRLLCRSRLCRPAQGHRCCHCPRLRHLRLFGPNHRHPDLRRSLCPCRRPSRPLPSCLSGRRRGSRRRGSHRPERRRPRPRDQPRPRRHGTRKYYRGAALGGHRGQWC